MALHGLAEFKDVIEQCLFPGFEKVRSWPE